MDPSANLGEVVSDLVTGSEIDYRPKTYEHGTYRFNRLLPVQGPLNVPLSATNVTTTTIELPAKVFNLAKSVLRFTMQAPSQSSSGTTSLNFHADTIPCIDRLSLFTRSGVYIADLTNFNTFMKVTNKWTQSKEELMSNDIGEPSPWTSGATGNGTWTNGFQICNSEPYDLPQNLPKRKQEQKITTLPSGTNTVDVIPGFTTPTGADVVALIPSIYRTLNSGANKFQQHDNYRHAGNRMPQSITATGTIKQTEQRYLFSVGRANTQAASNADRVTFLNYLIKFGQIPHSIFSVNKDLYFGETLILQINWAPTNRISFAGDAFFSANEDLTSADENGIAVELHPASTYLGYTDPSGTVVAANTAAAVVAVAPAANSRLFQMNNVTCYLAVETNRTLIETIVRQMATAGLRMLVPYTTCNKFTSSAGVVQNVQQRINRAWGRTLLRVYHSVFNLVETEIHAYNNYNVAGLNTVQSFYTTLDNDRLQEVNLDCTTQDEYLFMHEMVKGTAIQSPQHLQANWTWVDDWTGRSPVEYKKMDIGECGLTLAQERLWQIYMTMASNTGYNHYSFFVTQKMLTITPSQIMIV